MRDIWNPWHGCVKISEGCANCFMYFLDKKRDRDGSVFHVNKTTFKYPLQKNRSGNYKVPAGSMLRVCMTSDFFLDLADEYRPAVWDIIHTRSDIVFWLLTKRPERIMQCLPDDWDGGYENVWLGVTAENQRRTDERLPILLSVPAKHKHVNCAPLIGPVDLSPYLTDGQIQDVGIGGENYDGCRPCRDEWVAKIFNDCVVNNIRCHLYETGTHYIRDGREYWNPNKTDQSVYAAMSPYHFDTQPTPFKLTLPKSEDPLPPPSKRQFSEICRTCSTHNFCMGCTGCNKCGRFTGFIEIPEFDQNRLFTY